MFAFGRKANMDVRDGVTSSCSPFHNLSFGKTEFSRHISALSSPNHVSKKRAQATE
jgi:hypothetical protein